MLRAQQRAAAAYLPLSGALKARNTRDVLKSTAVQLITPNLLEAADYEAEGERGHDLKNHLHCLDLPILQPSWHLRVTQSF
jgi:hypothetical protein